MGAGKNEGCGYIGAIPNSGAAVVKAPAGKPVKKNVTVHRGRDLRTGKEK